MGGVSDCKYLQELAEPMNQLYDLRGRGALTLPRPQLRIGTKTYLQLASWQDRLSLSPINIEFLTQTVNSHQFGVRVVLVHFRFVFG